MSVPAELRYTAEHEWVAIAGETATIEIGRASCRERV